MSEPTDLQVIQLVRSAMSQTVDSPSADLWPRVQSRVHQSERPSAGDYLLAAAALVTCLLQPSLITHLVLML